MGWPVSSHWMEAMMDYAQGGFDEIMVGRAFLVAKVGAIYEIILLDHYT